MLFGGHLVQGGRDGVWNRVVWVEIGADTTPLCSFLYAPFPVSCNVFFWCFFRRFLASSQKGSQGSMRDLSLAGTPLASAPSTPGSIISETPSRYGRRGSGGGGSPGGGGGGSPGGGGGDGYGEDDREGDRAGRYVADDDAVIYGTTVNVNEAMASFRRFLREFRLDEQDTHDDPYV